MGACASWLSVGGLSKPEVLRRLRLAETSEPIPDGFFPRDDEVCVSELPSGRILVLAGDHRFEPDFDQAVSLGCEFVGGQIEEHVMYSRGWECRDGALIWSATCDPDDADVAITGKLPQQLSAALKAKDADAFEIPLDAVAEIGRFKVGEDLDGWSWDVSLVGDVEQLRRLAEIQARSTADRTAKAEKAAVWKASGGLVRAVKRYLVGR